MKNKLLIHYSFIHSLFGVGAVLHTDRGNSKKPTHEMATSCSLCLVLYVKPL